jgi:hypothetical protein
LKVETVADGTAPGAATARASDLATFLTSVNSKECALAEPTTLPFSAVAAGTI